MNRSWRKVSLLLFTGFLLTTVSGQSGSAIFFKDSLSVTEESFFLYNMVGLRLDGRSATLHVQPPAGWKLLGPKRYLFPASADTVARLSLTLVRQAGASAEFTPVLLRVETDDPGSQYGVLDTFFYVRAPSIHSFSVTLPNPVIEVPAAVKKIPIPFRISNKGTTNGQYRISLTSSFSEDPIRFTLRLSPGTDSVVNYTLALPAGTLQNSPRLLVSVADSTGMIQSVPVTLAAPGHSRKAHATPFSDFPAVLEAGIMMTDRQYSYYGAANASWLLKEGSVDLSFRSKLYGPLNTIERNVFTGQLRHKRWDLTLGQINSIQHFFSYGRGISASYRLSPEYQVGIQIIRPTVPGTFTNSTYSVWLQRRIAEASSVFRAVANSDVKKGLKEYLLSFETAWQFDQATHVKFNISAGWERFLRVPVVTDGVIAFFRYFDKSDDTGLSNWPMVLS